MSQLLSTRFSQLTLSAMTLLIASLSYAQIQASCTFHLLTLSTNPSKPVIYVKGVNDYGTVTGTADFGSGSTPRFRAFVHYSGAGVTYWVPSGAVGSEFDGRNNSGAIAGFYWDASNRRFAFLKQGSTVTKFQDSKAVPYRTFTAGINKYNSIVGNYQDSSGNQQGYKRYSNNTFVDLRYPGAQQTFPNSINDSGAVVGTYIYGGAEHGFMYHSGQWAKLDYPNSNITELWGISNAGTIVGITGGPRSFLYKSGTFKLISYNSRPTEVNAIAPGGLVAGRTSLSDGYHGFVAACQ